MEMKSGSEKEETILEEIKDKFRPTEGILVWGKTSAGQYVAVLVDSDGKLIVKR